VALAGAPPVIGSAGDRVLDGLAPMSQYAAVSLRTASGFLESLRDGREIWLGGERVVDVTAHPLLRGAALTIAELYAL
jgi:4-hydroxyphenylacetate 3-hydroxylase N terminal